MSRPSIGAKRESVNGVFFGMPKKSPYVPDNPSPHLIPEGENATPLEVIGSTATDKLVIIMVGLPGCGKTHMAKRICRYLEFFLDIPAKIFNVGQYRREICGAQMPASFFDHSDAEALAERSKACDAAMCEMMDYMKKDGVRVGVYDSTNSTKERRRHLIDKLKKEGVGAKKIFLESICDDEDHLHLDFHRLNLVLITSHSAIFFPHKLLKVNIEKTKLANPDYKGVDPEDAVRDFKKRREFYRSVYEPLDETDGSYMKIIDCEEFVVHRIRGYLPLKVVHFVMSLHTMPSTFYFSRHGQSEYNVLGKIGGDSGLSKAGEEYARRLAAFAKETIATKVEINEDGDEVKTEIAARLWTSTLRRTQETSQFFEHNPIPNPNLDEGEEGDWVQFRPMAWRNLDELFAGACDGMTYKDIEKVFPDEFKRRQDDKLAYRYPRGESYMDVILRLDKMAQEMERSKEPLLIIGHQGILRILYAYFMGLPRDQAPYMNIPLNTIIQLKPHAYGCEEKRICLMFKEEMLNDGQDEPVTSMPVKNGEKVSITSYAKDDPIMNAPSC